MAEPKRVYWDACTWIGLINREANKLDACEYVLKEAESGRLEVWTSAFTLAEVFKKKCSAGQVGLTAADDVSFEDYLRNDYIVRVNVDDEIGTEARRLLRKFPTLKKPQDAVHLATAVINNLDEMHTFDDANLIGLNGQVLCSNGKALLIGPPAVPAPIVSVPTLFDE